MIFRNLDDNHDWKFGKGINDYATGNKAIALNIETRVLSWVKDCFFAQTAGIDWANRLGSKNQRTLLEADLRRIIQQSQNVTGINSFDIVFSENARSFIATYSINTIFSAAYVNSIKAGV